LRRLLFDVATDPVDDVSGSIDIANDTGECFPDLAQIRQLHVHKVQGGTSVVARAGDGLPAFMAWPPCHIVGESHQGIKSAPATNRQNPLSRHDVWKISTQRTGQQWVRPTVYPQRREAPRRTLGSQ
jgi:hypothetical protein